MLGCPRSRQLVKAMVLCRCLSGMRLPFRGSEQAPVGSALYHFWMSIVNISVIPWRYKTNERRNNTNTNQNLEKDRGRTNAWHVGSPPLISF